MKQIIVLAKEVKEKFPDKDIWCWSGYLLEEIQAGKVHDYWQYTPGEIAVIKQKAKERRRQRENQETEPLQQG